MLRVILLSFLCLIAVPALAADAKEVPDAFHSSHLPLPRFVSLQADEVYVRSGPGVKYPVKWVYKKPGLPVEVILEYEVWRKIKDHEGAIGWVHQTLLSGKRSGVIQYPPLTAEEKKKAAALAKAGVTPAPEPIPVYQKPRENAQWVVKAAPGVIASLDECFPGWCLIAADGYKGWIDRKYIWGLYPGENFKK
jgi:SH3-like domain-containing protein